MIDYYFVALVSCIWFFGIGDTTTTLVGYYTNILYERNPVIRNIISFRFGGYFWIILKILFIAVASFSALILFILGLIGLILTVNNLVAFKNYFDDSSTKKEVKS